MLDLQGIPSILLKEEEQRFPPLSCNQDTVISYQLPVSSIRHHGRLLASAFV